MFSSKYEDDCKVSTAPTGTGAPSDKVCKCTCDHRLPGFPFGQQLDSYAMTWPGAGKSSQVFLLSRDQTPQPEVDR